MRAGDVCQLAAELAIEHGPAIREYAHHATLMFQVEGKLDRAQFWFSLAVLLDDIAEHRLDPHIRVTIH
jgi:hypothetical protein